MRAVRRFEIDGRLVPLGTCLQTDSLRLVASMVQQGDARPLDAATERDVALFALLRRAIPAAGTTSARPGHGGAGRATLRLPAHAGRG